MPTIRARLAAIASLLQFGDTSMPPPMKRFAGTGRRTPPIRWNLVLQFLSFGRLPMNVSTGGMMNSVGFRRMTMSGEAESGSAGTQLDEE